MRIRLTILTAAIAAFILSVPQSTSAQPQPKSFGFGIILGEPLDFSRFDGMEGDRFILRSVTDEIMYELQRLGEQEYVDVYASTVKEKRATLSR